MTHDVTLGKFSRIMFPSHAHPPAPYGGSTVTTPSRTANINIMSIAKLILATFVSAAAATTCDIYDAAGTPCVAAHSVVRALFKA